jgi:hypothetical protein
VSEAPTEGRVRREQSSTSHESITSTSHESPTEFREAEGPVERRQAGNPAERRQEEGPAYYPSEGPIPLHAPFNGFYDSWNPSERERPRDVLAARFGRTGLVGMEFMRMGDRDVGKLAAKFRVEVGRETAPSHPLGRV